MRGAGEGTLLVAEQFALEQRFGHPRAVDRDERPVRAHARLVNGPGNQLLSGAGLAEQQHAGIRSGDTQDALEHGHEGRRATDQALRRRPAAGLANDTHGLDEVDDLPRVVADRRRFDIDVLLAARRVVKMQDALRRPGVETLPERA